MAEAVVGSNPVILWKYVSINPIISFLKLTQNAIVGGTVLPAGPLCVKGFNVVGSIYLLRVLGGQTLFLQMCSSCVAWDTQAGRAAACTLTLGQVKRRPSSHPSSIALTPLLPPVNMSLSDGKVNKFCSRLKVLIISFVNDK